MIVSNLSFNVKNNYKITGQNNAQFSMSEVVVLYARRDRHATSTYLTNRKKKPNNKHMSVVIKLFPSSLRIDQN